MAAFHGKRASGSFTGITFEVQSFTIDATAETVDVTVMDSAAVAAATHWKEYLTGFKDWTATVNVILPLAGIGLTSIGTEAELTLDMTETGGRLYKGNAILTGVSMATGSDAPGTTTLTFQGTDQLEENAT
ncbi:hypothetical protein LCGC14_0421480 [marine sediment metagenome]|uniref:Uncharacterized protein n=1 Tax=marine sediment metagenome TaxID=412755 RepID=A0A0F9VCY7_9ZZZZ